MNTVLLGTNNGNLYMYDLPKALENERFINKKRLDMGVEEELVFTFLERVPEENFLEHTMPNQSMSEIATISKMFHGGSGIGENASFVQTIA
jgi:hypothetical protein